MTTHCVASIYAQIKEGKFKLADIDEWLPKIGCQRLDLDAHTWSESTGQQFRNASQHSREVHRLLIQFLATSKRQKPLRKSSPMLCDPHKRGCQPAHLPGIIRTGIDKIDSGHNCLKHISEIMGDTGG